MKPTRLCIATAVALLVCVPAAGAARGTVRVMTAEHDLIGPAPQLSGAVRAYLDDTDTAVTLPPGTVMGQLFAAAAVHDLAVSVHVSAFGGFVTAIGGVAPDPNAGFWELFVNDQPASVGADQTTLHTGDEVVWVLDPDFTTPGPSFLDLDMVRRRPGRAVLHVTRVDETGAAAAAGARVRVRGHWYTAGAGGDVTVRVRGAWSARARLSGSISSPVLSART